MKNIGIAPGLIVLVTLSLKAQEMSVFLMATKSGWYPEFLAPVVAAIHENVESRKLLDIGTGPGTLPQLLIQQDSKWQIVAIDIDAAMINVAKNRVRHKNIAFQIQNSNAPLAFDTAQFDVVTFCSVLFLVSDGVKTELMNEALRVLKQEGQIIVLTPSGKKSIGAAFVEVWKYPFSIYNVTFPIWRIATSRGGKNWQRQRWLEDFAHQNQLSYSKSWVFNDNATIEIISKKNLQ